MGLFKRVNLRSNVVRSTIDDVVNFFSLAKQKELEPFSSTA